MVLGFFAPLLAVIGQSPIGDKPATMDQAIRLITQARERFEKVHDYECKLLKRERVGGVLLPESELTMKVRNEPFSVYLRCDNPSADRGLEVCYVAGRNHGRMHVHPNGFFSFIGFVSLSPRDPRAFEKNRHCVTEAGLGNLLESTAKNWDMERSLNKTQVEIREEVCCGRECTRIVTIHSDRQAGSFYGYRCMLWLDKETLLPLGAETYDWPRLGSPPGGDLLERYRFLDIRCNVGLSDNIFNQ